MKSGRLLGMAVLVPLAMAVTGCVSEEKPGKAKAAYIEQSDAICADVIPKSESIGSTRDQATAQQQADLWLDANNRLKAIPAPQESVELARQFVTITDNLFMSYQAAARAFEANDQAKANKAYADIDDLKKRGAEAADEYGYNECVLINGTTVVAED